MILDPVNAVTSVAFYRRVAEQKTGRTIAYLAFISAIFAACVTAAIALKIMPTVNEAAAWMEQNTPVLTFANGKVSSNLEAPVTLRPPNVPFAFVIDTTRVDPVTPPEMENQRAVAFLTQNAFYVFERPGEIKTHDLSRMPTNRPVVVDPAVIRGFMDMLRRAIYPVSLVITFVAFLGWKLFATLFPYGVIGLLINGLSGAQLPFRSVFNIAAYAQTFIVAVWIVLLFSPAALPAFPLIALVATTVYIWLGIRRTMKPEAAPAAG